MGISKELRGMRMEKEELKMCFEMGLEMGLERKGGLRVRYFDSRHGLGCRLFGRYVVLCGRMAFGICGEFAGGFGLLMQGSYVDGFRMIGKASVASESSFTLDLRASLARSWVEGLRAVLDVKLY